MISVKVMQSYDYNHFEICLGTDDEPDIKRANELRKMAQRLTDEAVRQYKKAKELANKRYDLEIEQRRLRQEVEMLKQNKPVSEWSAEDKAKVKALEDKEYWEQYNYDYDDDDWE